MLFYSQSFLLFFLAVFVVYWSVPWNRVRVGLLLAASVYFYASWNPSLALIVCLSTTADWILARAMDWPPAARWRRWLVGLSVVGNLGLLCYFKYMNFFLRSLEDALHAAGSSASLPVLQVILPIGISFYTFEAISYTVDVYRKRIPAERSLARFMVFILFFPHLIAGPIVRARDFLPQVRRPKQWDWARIHLGLQFFLVGLVKKLVIADRMALYVDPVFANPAGCGPGAAWLGVLAYALQIYCDFSGYSDMAIGSAHLLGYKLAANFNMPYLAANVSDFWRRWHISLSSWLRDYLFISLGGSRGGRWATARNLLIVMALGGLWHGASWTFVAWGVLHGLFLIVHRVFRSLCDRLPVLAGALATPPGYVLRIVVTFLSVSLAWIFFRARTFEAALTLLGQLVPTRAAVSSHLLTGDSLVALGLVVLGCHLVALLPACRREAARLPAPLLGLGYALVLWLVMVLSPDTSGAFIYFQF